MDLPVILLIAAGLWFCVLALFLSLCKAARVGDEAMLTSHRRSSVHARPRPRRKPYMRYHLHLVVDRMSETADRRR